MTAPGIPHYVAENSPAPGTILYLMTRAQPDHDGMPPAVPPNAKALPNHAFLRAHLRLHLPARSRAPLIQVPEIHAARKQAYRSAPLQHHWSASAQPMPKYPSTLSP
jgi:hypothetical protein